MIPCFLFFFLYVYELNITTVEELCETRFNFASNCVIILFPSQFNVLLKITNKMYIIIKGCFNKKNAYSSERTNVIK